MENTIPNFRYEFGAKIRNGFHRNHFIISDENFNTKEKEWIVKHNEIDVYRCSYAYETEDIEYIYPDYTTKGKTFIRTKTPSEYPERKEGELLKKVPEEYRDQKDWFLRYEEQGGELPFLELILKNRK